MTVNCGGGHVRVTAVGEIQSEWRLNEGPGEPGCVLKDRISARVSGWPEGGCTRMAFGGDLAKMVSVTMTRFWDHWSPL